MDKIAAIYLSRDGDTVFVVEETYGDLPEDKSYHARITINFWTMQPTYSGTLLDDLATVEENLLRQDPSRVKIASIADYPMFAYREGDTLSVSLQQDERYTDPVRAGDVPKGARLTKGAENFFVRWTDTDVFNTKYRLK